MSRQKTKVDRIANALSWAYVFDRAVKMVAVAHFFNKRPPPAPSAWPGVTLLQPITKGASDLRAALDARAHLDYPASIQHLLVCDAGDVESQRVCKEWIARNPALDAQIVPVASGSGGPIASKTEKLQAGLARATGEVVCCVDDDIILRPDALRVMLPYLFEQGVGAVFGLACYIDWSNLPSSLMSGFVNSNALLTYIPGLYVTQPFSITGHIFAVKHDTLLSVDAFAGLENNVGDDHILARRLREAGLHLVQTPMIYDVENHLPILASYSTQIKRWFIFPRQMVLPYLTAKESVVTSALSLGNLIPTILLLMGLLSRDRAAFKGLARSMAAFNIVYSICERRYLKRITPAWRRPIVALSALVTPAQILGALLSNNEIEWRGRRLRIEVGGDFTDVQSETR